MTTEQHKLTRSYGNALLNKQEKNLTLRQIFELDIADYVKITGNQKSADELRSWHKINSDWY